MVGSINDKHGTELVAFRTGERVTLDYPVSYTHLDVYKRQGLSERLRKARKQGGCQ